MLNQIQIQAPAKINLFLKILNKREDGYHNIISLFRKIGLFDDLSIKVETASFFSCKISGNFSIPDKENIIWRAAEIFSCFIQRDLFFTIACKKNIPEGAGLGGGSSDAAATLIAANELMGNPCSTYELKSLAEKLGSDVPFFIDSFPTALITGRGEVIKPVPCSDKNYWLVIVYPGFEIFTGGAYKGFDFRHGRGSTEIMQNAKQISLLSKSLCTQVLHSPDSWIFTNDFEEVLSEEYPVYITIKELLVQSGALFTSLTGSGSAYFGIFSNKISAEKAETLLTFHLPAPNQIMQCQF